MKEIWKPILSAISLGFMIYMAWTHSCRGADDGAAWEHLSRAQKIAWADGWKNGVCMASNVAHVDAIADTPAAQIAEGLDQFYQADYRNRTVPLQVSAIIVARFARGEITHEQALASAEAFRVH